MSTPARSRRISDPLTLAALPPPDESDIDRERRLRREIEAKKVSDSIDDQLKQERAALKKKKQVRALVEQRLQTELVGERRTFMDRQIDTELSNM